MVLFLQFEVVVDRRLRLLAFPLEKCPLGVSAVGTRFQGESCAGADHDADLEPLQARRVSRGGAGHYRSRRNEPGRDRSVE